MANVTEELEAMNKPAEDFLITMTQIGNRAFGDQKGLVEDLADAYTDLDDAQGEWVQSYVNNTDDVSNISVTLAGDLTDDQRRSFQETLGTVQEGGQEWLSIYQALQGDLTDSQRAELVARQAELEANHGQVVQIFTGDAEAAEEAQERIDAAMLGITESYKKQVFDSLFYQQIEDGTFDQAMADTAVGLGLLNQEQADLLVETARVSSLLTTATSDFRDELLELDPTQLAEFVDILAGEDSSIWTALGKVRDRTVDELLPEFNGDDGLYMSMDKMSAPVTGFRETVDTEYPKIGIQIDTVKQKALELEAVLNRLATNPYNIAVTAGGLGSGVMDEARATGYQP